MGVNSQTIILRLGDVVRHTVVPRPACCRNAECGTRDTGCTSVSQPVGGTTEVSHSYHSPSAVWSVSTRCLISPQLHGVKLNTDITLNSLNLNSTHNDLHEYSLIGCENFTACVFLSHKILPRNSASPAPPPYLAPTARDQRRWKLGAAVKFHLRFLSPHGSRLRSYRVDVLVGTRWAPGGLGWQQLVCAPCSRHPHIAWLYKVSCHATENSCGFRALPTAAVACSELASCISSLSHKVLQAGGAIEGENPTSEFIHAAGYRNSVQFADLPIEQAAFPRKSRAG